MSFRVYEPRAGTRVALALRQLLHVMDAARAAGVTDERELRRWMRDAWLWGEREGWPYKAWLRARRIAIARWRQVDYFPVSLPYLEDPELDAWLRQRGFQAVAPNADPDRDEASNGEQISLV